MTLVFDEARFSRRSRRSWATAAIPAALNSVIAAWREWHRRRQEGLALEAMPFDLRKDLGWPAGDMEDRTRP
ncbi:hypothetical protein ACWKW9_07870 [Rhizobium daejeonense]